MSVDFTEELIGVCPVVVRRRVLWGDCDPAAVVYTPRFADYVVSARDWFLSRGLGIMNRPHPLRKGINLPLRAMHFDFISFLAADDIFDMMVRVAEVRTQTFTAEVRAMHADGHPVFTSRLTTIAVDSETQKSVELPEAVRAALDHYAATQDGPEG